MMPSKLEIIAEPGTPTIITRRVVNAPRELVWDVFTKPEYLKRWWGPRTLTLVVCEVDLRVGGGYRFVQRAPDGQEFGFHGEYREIIRPERIVNTFVFELMPDHEALQTLVLEEHDAKTTVTSTTLHKTFEDRDAHLASGMDAGLRDTYVRLDELLAADQTH
jgi:uncharacterized protein YndB with AHSA1/START domain